MDSFLKAYRLLLAEGEPGSLPNTIASIIPARTVLLEVCNRHAAVVAKAVLTCFPCDCAWNTSTCRYAAAVFQHILSRAKEEVYEELTLDEADPARCDGPPDVTFAYNPPRDGAAYYFNMDGRRVRKVRRVKVPAGAKARPLQSAVFWQPAKLCQLAGKAKPANSNGRLGAKRPSTDWFFREAEASRSLRTGPRAKAPAE